MLKFEKCKQCGGNDQYLYVHTTKNPEERQYIVRCRDCGAKSPFARTQNGAKRKWDNLNKNTQSK